ncbi:MAG: NeuD/PglB/VioB family sugar acetyltransferase [Acidobacteriaceae bacterium]
MSDAIPIIIPLLNPNEPEARLVELNIQAGQYVHDGEQICSLETTKSTAVVYAETDGYVVGLDYHSGQNVMAGDVLAYIAASPSWVPPARIAMTAIQAPPLPEGLRISQPALRLAQQHNLNLGQLTGNAFVTEKMVQGLIDVTMQPEARLQSEAYDPNSIIVYGGGGHGKALIDLIRVEGSHRIVGIVDDGMAAGDNVMGVPILGGAGILKQLVERGVHLAANAVGGIGNIQSRIKVFERLTTAGFSCPDLIHPTAFIEPSSVLSLGVQVMPHAYVGSETKIGYGVIVNTGAIVSHDCSLGDYANLSPGAILAGEVKIGAGTLVGMGVTINLGVKVGERARIGNGATIKQDVPDGGIVRAGSVWPE